MIRGRLLIFILTSFIPTCVYAQDITNFTQFFINPYSINPSYAGIEGRPALSLAYRRQWMDIEGGPAIGNFTLHAPTPLGINYGLSFANDARGILSTSSGVLTLGYTLSLDKHKFIRFGVSGGVSYNTIDLDEFEGTTDPVLINILDKSASLIGNAGLSFHLNTVHFGAALPNIFSPAYVSEDAFSIKEVKPFQSVIVHGSNRFYFNKDKHVFEPYLIYRINQDLPSQIEAAAVLHLNHVIWFGGSYKQDFGISALGGVKVQNFFLIGGSYSLRNTGANELNSPTFEVQLSFIFGAKKKDIPVYSFVNTVKEKEKIKKKSASEQLAEKRKADEEKKKKDAAALAKKQDDEAKAKAAAATAAAAAATKKPVDPVKEPVAVVTPPTPAKHDGGPRLKSEVLAIDMLTTPSYDTAHHEEQARIKRIEDHTNDPDEHHTDSPDTHPNAERHEFVKRGGHKDELDVADYVVVGVFKSDANATHFSDGLKKLGFVADYGHLTEKNLWYVYIAQATDINQARAERDKYRKMKIFRDAWLLTVFH
jgi:type IX secretion system PorP/SprF family membrane protein